jgi:hypothetical protein
MMGEISVKQKKKKKNRSKQVSANFEQAKYQTKEDNVSRASTNNRTAKGQI